MAEPKVSVIIHSYNRYEYLMNALKSVENQTYKNYEVILIYDDIDKSELEYAKYILKKIKKKK